MATRSVGDVTRSDLIDELDDILSFETVFHPGIAPCRTYGSKCASFLPNDKLRSGFTSATAQYTLRPTACSQTKTITTSRSKWHTVYSPADNLVDDKRNRPNRLCTMVVSYNVDSTS